MENPFFEKEIYTKRRNILKQEMRTGIILLLGNDESSSNFKDNWFPFRQDSTFLYYGGISIANLAIIINADTGEEILFGDELSIDDIIWTGKQTTLHELADLVGINKVMPLNTITNFLKAQVAYTPPYRPEHLIKLSEWLSIPIKSVETNTSLALIKAITKQRSIKSPEEIRQLELAATITARMHKAVMSQVVAGMYEYEVAAIGQKVLWENNASNSFLPIVTINGNVLHNHYYGNKLTEGKMLLFDSGAELKNGYCGDMTRTIPIGKQFTVQQKEIYTIVYDSYTKAVSLLKPDITFKDIHLAACVEIANGLIEMGLMKGNAEEAVATNAHTLFFQCGLGHMIGLDAHDMESFGEENFGYTDELIKSKIFGLKSLRLGKKLEENHCLTVEPGIYIIPELIEKCKAENLYTDFVNYNKLESFKNFGGIRVEDAFVITKNGSKLLGEPLAINCDAVEALRS